jgi:hypothetical protein
MRNFLKTLVRRFRGAKPPGDALKPRDYFSQVFKRNSWGGRQSKSGPGSEGAFAQQKITLIKDMMTGYGVSSILDFGCGDFSWMAEVAPGLGRYHGVDVVKKLTDKNTRRFGSPTISFQCLDLSDPAEQRLLAVKNADLLTCFDVFGHLLNREVDSLLQFIFSGCAVKFILVTNRRDAESARYLVREKSRFEGIDLERHPLFIERRPQRLKRVPGLYPDDYFDLYRLD